LRLEVVAVGVGHRDGVQAPGARNGYSTRLVQRDL
jgi:hypothetical protein